MGWSCSRAASGTMRAWTEACGAQTGSSNEFEFGGERYFWEASNREHDDGAITGTVMLMLKDRPGFCRKVATFRIDGDGSCKRAPKFLKEAAVTYRRSTEHYAIGSGGMA